MSVERPSAVIFGGQPMTLIGPQLKEGDMAPDFEAVGSDLKTVRFSALMQAAPFASAPIKIVSSVPSLDTGVCSDETHRFEEEVAKLNGQAALITVSMDLPFAQGRFCDGKPKEHTVFLSDHRLADFGQKYGTLIKEVRLLSRAVFVVDAHNKIVHVQYVKETGTHPDYGAVISAVKESLGQ